MGSLRNVEPAALVAGILHADQEAAEAALSRLVERYGPLAMTSDTFAFTMTGYYEQEMGPGLGKYFVCFDRPVMPGALASIKLETNAIERMFADTDGMNERRRVNIDPGYVTPAKLVLASTKDFSHRVYIGKGIYGEVTLRSTGGRLAPVDTTYPDYQTPLALDFFNHVRRFARENRARWMRHDV